MHLALDPGEMHVMTWVLPVGFLDEISVHSDLEAAEIAIQFDLVSSLGAQNASGRSELRATLCRNLPEGIVRCVGAVDQDQRPGLDVGKQVLHKMPIRVPR